ncbi:hypothetical protein PAESOLCIP111_04158 [Paenibacillus solanacearum]|uniref:Uncharacterized protein n=1 Tax=Paenibacillus solanacearum TaxID=2048548 RepID=A0A916K3T1_9BACL|nr:hypothetical protein PAESOLCIP111_04158 [Paenibacillus solanacearum]
MADLCMAFMLAAAYVLFACFLSWCGRALEEPGGGDR